MCRRSFQDVSFNLVLLGSGWIEMGGNSELSRDAAV